MTCREAEKLLDLFLDGELEARTMRAVALHVTRCAPCEALLQRLERLQDLLADGINEAVGDVDLSRLWPSIATRADAIQRSWRGIGSRLRELGYRPAALAVAAALALAFSAFALWTQAIGPSPATPAQNNQARIDALTSDAPSVTVLSEPISNTTVIWVADEEAGR